MCEPLVGASLHVQCRSIQNLLAEELSHQKCLVPKFLSMADLRGKL